MKKIIALVISMMMLLLAVGCGGGDEKKADGDKKITMGFSQIGAESEWRTANTESVKEAAKAAGIFTIAVNTGPLPDKVLLDEGADMLFPSMQALCDGWGQLNS